MLLNEEKKFLNKIKDELLKCDIDLEIHYFGLGSKEHMAEYLAKADAVLPDIMISADLEVYEDKYIFSKLGELYECEEWIKLKETDIVQSLRRKKTLLPFLAIPLVCYTNDKKYANEKSLPDLVRSEGFAFGGINNSAGKTIAKLSLQEYGYDFTESLLEKSRIYDMPIGSFQGVRLNQSKTALVPTLYAMRADGVKTFQTRLKEGTVLLPTYLAARTSIDEDTAQLVARRILCEELSCIYAKNANMVICLDYDSPERTEDTIEEYCVVKQEFLDELEEKSFYDLYTLKIPTARYLYNQVCN